MRERGVPHNRASLPCLQEDQVRRLAELALKAEVALGGPQDVEWAMWEDRFYPLQSMPMAAGDQQGATK